MLFYFVKPAMFEIVIQLKRSVQNPALQKLTKLRLFLRFGHYLRIKSLDNLTLHSKI